MARGFVSPRASSTASNTLPKPTKFSSTSETILGHWLHALVRYIDAAACAPGTQHNFPASFSLVSFGGFANSPPPSPPSSPTPFDSVG